MLLFLPLREIRGKELLARAKFGYLCYAIVKVLLLLA